MTACWRGLASPLPLWRRDRIVAEADEDQMRARAVDVLGTAVAIDVPVSVWPELGAALRDLEPATGADRELALVPGERGFDLCDGGRIIRRGVDPTVGVATLVWRLNAIAAESTSHVLLHAACVAQPQGGGILLVGGAGAGKSTLAAALVRAGMVYLSDELAGIDCETGMVTPYPKPLALDGDRLVPASSLGEVAAGPVVPAALVFPRYQRDTGITDVRFDAGWTFLALAAHAINLRSLGRPALAWLAGLALACPARQVTHADAGAAVSVIGENPGGPARRLEPAEMLAPVTPDTITVAVGDSLAVLHEPSGRVNLLNPSAAALWRSAAGARTHGQDMTTLVDAALAGIDTADGGRPDRGIASATIDHLARSGLIAPAEGWRDCG
jgi:hypothetical protein